MRLQRERVQLHFGRLLLLLLLLCGGLLLLSDHTANNDNHESHEGDAAENAAKNGS